jgi:hypothetical protein
LKNALPVAPASNVTYVIFPGTAATDLSTETIGSVLTVINAASDYSVVLKPQVHSLATVRGLENVANIPSGGSSPAQIADAIWDEARSGHVAAGSFGQYVVTDAGSGLSSDASILLRPTTHSLATIRGIENDSVMTIAGVTNTATLINALNDIDGSAVTLHAGTHSNVTIQGVSNYLNLPGVTLDGTSSAGSITGLVLTGGSGTTAFYDGQLVTITGGTGAGQARTILDYRGDTNLATVTREFATAPDATSEFLVTAADIPAILEAGTAQAGAAGTITLDAQASAVNSTYVDEWIMITAGTGIGQTRVIGVYNGTTKVATVVPNWTTTPDATSVYQIIPAARVDVAAWAGNAVTASGGNPDVNVESIDAIDSALTVFVKDSIATIAGVTNVQTQISALNNIDGSAVTLHAGTHSNATIQGIQNWSNLSGTFSDLTTQVTGIVPASFNAGAIDAAALATDAGQEIADRMLVRNIEGGDDSGRTVGEALAALRNRVQISSDSLIVYRNDDSTVWWHASIATTGASVFLTDANPDV